MDAIAANGDFSRPTFADHLAFFHPDYLDLSALVARIVVVQNLSNQQHFLPRVECRSNFQLSPTPPDRDHLSRSTVLTATICGQVGDFVDCVMDCVEFVT
jgi:hypothetical protein